MLSAKEIRQSFKDFFQSKGHRIVPSGRIQMQNVDKVFPRHIDGFSLEIIAERPVSEHLEHCMVVGVESDLLEVVVLAADAKTFLRVGNERDNEAASIWAKHLPADHILNGNKHDNFWEMGDTGPCGAGLRIGGKLGIGDRESDCTNVVGYHSHGHGMALQGKTSNYDTDVFTPLIDKIASLSGKKYGEDHQVDVAMRVIADIERERLAARNLRAVLGLGGFGCIVEQANAILKSAQEGFPASLQCEGRLCDSSHSAPRSPLRLYLP